MRVNGKLAEKDVELFFLDGRDLLNKTFGTDALTGGFKIGIAKLVVRTALS